MKRILMTAIGLTAIMAAQAQTYYWIGGTDNTAADFRAKSNWSTSLGGTTISGTGNITVSSALSLIYDGSNLGSGANNTVAIVSNINGGLTVGQVKVINGAKVIFQRGSSTGTTTFIINGDGTTDDDLVVGANSTLSIVSTANYGITVQLGITTTATATGAVAGKININGPYVNRIYAQNAGALVFASGSTCTVNTTGSYYPLGLSGSSAEGGVVFQTGASLVYQGGYSVFGNNSTFNAISLQNGSNFVFESANAANMFASRYFGNVIVRNSAAVIADGAFYNIDSLAVETGASLALNPSAQSPVSGSIFNNGTLSINGTATSAVLVMNGTTPKTIGGSGTYALNKLTMGTGSDITLQSNLTLSDNLLMEGKLNLQSNVISGSGSFETRAAATDAVTGDVTAGSYTVSNVSPASPVAAVGTLVSGTGIPANTYITYSLSNGTWTLSKPATATATGVTIATVRGAGRITSSAAAGLDGNLAITGTKSLDANTAYVFNAATTAPFPASGAAFTAKSIVVNANVTLNRNVTVTDSLVLASGNVTIPDGDTLQLNSGNVLSGTGFGDSKHIITQADATTGAAGVLQINNISSATLFPVGSATHYLPVTLTPTAADNYAVNVFEGLTNNGVPNGTATTSTNNVNAVWNINRPVSAAPCTVSLSWPAALEGISFSGLSNSDIGIRHFNGTDWDDATGTGDNTANTATGSFTTFSPFSVGQTSTPLPLFILNEKATWADGQAIISWETATEENGIQFAIEKSADGKTFKAIGNVAAQGGYGNTYQFPDATVTNGASFYRIKASSPAGKVTYSKTLLLTVNENNAAQLQVYPNPASSQIYVVSSATTATIAVLTDLNGKALRTVTLQAGTNHLSLEALVPGIYFLKTSNTGSVRFVVE